MVIYLLYSCCNTTRVIKSTSSITKKYKSYSRINSSSKGFRESLFVARTRRSRRECRRWGHTGQTLTGNVGHHW